MQPLSELEGVVLGIVRGAEPCTAYQVRLTLQASPSSFWSASTGSIYPLLKRLKKAGLVSAKADSTDGRRRRLLRTTKSGRDAHLRWIRTASSLDVAAAVSDPIRSRAFFIGQLREKDRKEFIEGSLLSLKRFAEDAKADLEDKARSPDVYGYLAALGALRQAEARVTWMEEIRDHTSGGDTGLKGS